MTDETGSPLVNTSRERREALIGALEHRLNEVDKRRQGRSKYGAKRPKVAAK